MKSILWRLKENNNHLIVTYLCESAMYQQRVKGHRDAVRICVHLAASGRYPDLRQDLGQQRRLVISNALTSERKIGLFIRNPELSPL